MYQQIIDKIASIIIGGLFAELLLPIIWFFITLSTCRKARIAKTALIIPILMMIFAVVSFGYNYYTFRSDVKNEAYISYEGKIESIYNDDDLPITVKLCDGNETKVKVWFRDRVSYGMNEGKIVYTENSKHALYLRITS